MLNTYNLFGSPFPLYRYIFIPLRGRNECFPQLGYILYSTNHLRLVTRSRAWQQRRQPDMWWQDRLFHPMQPAKQPNSMIAPKLPAKGMTQTGNPSSSCSIEGQCPEFAAPHKQQASLQAKAISTPPQS